MQTTFWWIAGTRADEVVLALLTLYTSVYSNDYGFNKHKCPAHVFTTYYVYYSHTQTTRVQFNKFNKTTSPVQSILSSIGNKTKTNTTKLQSALLWAHNDCTRGAAPQQQRVLPLCIYSLLGTLDVIWTRLILRLEQLMRWELCCRSPTSHEEAFFYCVHDSGIGSVEAAVRKSSPNPPFTILPSVGFHGFRWEDTFQKHYL